MTSSCERDRVSSTDHQTRAVAPSRPRRVAALSLQVAVVLLILLGGLEAATRILVVAFQPAEGPSQSFDRKFILAQKPPLKHLPSLLFLGTSVGAFATDAELLASILQEKGYDLDVRNLCTTASRCPERLFLLQTAVQAGAKPAMVVWELDPLDISKYFLAHFQAISGKFTDSPLAVAHGQAADSLKMRLKRAVIDTSYTLKYRSFLQDCCSILPNLILHPEQRYDANRYISAAADLSAPRATSDLGWTPCGNMMPDSLFDNKDIRATFLQLRTGAARQDWFTLDGLRPVMEYCAKEHIPLMFVWYPRYPLTEAEKNEFSRLHLETFEQMTRSFSEALKDQRNCYVLDFQDSDHDRFHYCDLGHENPAGAVLFSTKLAERLLSAPYVSLLEKASIHKDRTEQ